MVDFSQIIRNLNTAINNFFSKVQAYFSSLTQHETYAWIAFAVGFVMVIIALVTW